MGLYLSFVGVCSPNKLGGLAWTNTASESAASVKWAHLDWSTAMTDRSEGLARTRLFHPWGCEPEEGGGQAPAFRVARCQTWSGVGPKTGRKLIKINKKTLTFAKVNMLKSGDVNFEFGFEW